MPTAESWSGCPGPATYITDSLSDPNVVGPIQSDAPVKPPATLHSPPASLPSRPTTLSSPSALPAISTSTGPSKITQSLTVTSPHPPSTNHHKPVHGPASGPGCVDPPVASSSCAPGPVSSVAPGASGVLGSWTNANPHVSHADWAGLPSVLVSSVASCMKERVRDVQRMMSVCRLWREALLQETLLLKVLYFSYPPTAWPTPPLPPAPTLCTLHQRLPLHSPPKHPVLQSRLEHCYRFPEDRPLLLMKAAKAGSPSACACLARLQEASGDVKAAMKWWDRAARRGHVEGKVMMGLALYKGVAGQKHDPESAHMWLEQAAKQLLEDPGCVSPSSRYNSMLSQSSLVLGYLHFDGETCRMVGGEKQQAVKWFKVAAGKGNKEAEEVLGWIFNTGQYG